jgi:hypothetical protein
LIKERQGPGVVLTRVLATQIQCGFRSALIAKRWRTRSM